VIDSGLIQREEKKRDACWNPVERWSVLQQTIAWVDSQQSVPRNSKKGCLMRQAQLQGLMRR